MTTTNSRAMADATGLLVHARRQMESGEVGGNWLAIVDRLDSLVFAVRQWERQGREVPSLDDVRAAVMGKSGSADKAVQALEDVLSVMERGL